MAGYRATSLNFVGYAGHIMLMKIRYGYGEQSHIEKYTILHSWYSDLRAYLPIIYERKPEEYTDKKRWGNLTIQELMTDAAKRLSAAWQAYNPAFEDMKTCNPEEKEFVVMLDGVKELLDEITAISKVIDKQQMDDEGMVIA